MSKKKPEKLSLAPETVLSNDRLLDNGGSMFEPPTGVSTPNTATTPLSDMNSNRKERSRSQGRLSQIFPNPFKPVKKCVLWLFWRFFAFLYHLLTILCFQGRPIGNVGKIDSFSRTRSIDRRRSTAGRQFVTVPKRLSN